MRRGENNETIANRSDAVRRRRSERSQKRVVTVADRASNPVPSRPVVVRGNAFGTPIHRQAGKRAPRRTFYVTMDQAAGSELRLPAIPLVNPGWRILSAIIAILAMVGIYSLMSSAYFRVQSVEVKGPERISPEEISKTLKLENLPVIELDTSAINQKLVGKYPELIGVRVSVEMPNFITITARERQPVAAWKKGDQVSWVDADGVIFPARGDAGALITVQSDEDPPLAPQPVDPAVLETQIAGGGEPMPMPTASAETTSANEEKKIEPDLLNAALALSKRLPVDTTLVYSSQNGLGWVDPQWGWQVYIGRDLSNVEDKLYMYQKVASYLVEQGKKASLVDVEHLNAPFYRLEQ